MVPKAVLMRSGLVSLTTARPVNTAQPKTTVNSARPMTNVFNKAHSTVRRPINNKTATKNSNFNKRVNVVSGKNVNTARPKVVVNAARPKAVLNVVKGKQVNVVKASACWVWKPKTKGNPQMDLQDQGVIDGGCSRHMTGNMSYLTNFEEIDGGYVAFGGNPKGGKITGRGTIKTGNLDFENVYFVRELKFNLFSVSQMCDKKNSVLFNDTECIVLSPNFKLTDESHVLLKVPRKNNMYSVDLKNIVPKGGLTCLFAKATSDESKLWHRRLGHINFKTMNKLVKGNLVRGLPSKLFEINQTCVACQKGKQHRASCKSKTVSSINQPLHMLHMDLFGPTFVKSLMKKMYCLVVTDDYSRFSWVFFLATKDETSGILKSFITRVENLIDQRVKVIRCDNGTEFKNKDINQFCKRKVPTSRVVVPTGMYVVPAGKVIIIISPSRLNLVPTGRILSPGSDNESDDASVHSEATIPQQQRNIQPQIITTVSNNNAKFPYLKKDEYESSSTKGDVVEGGGVSSNVTGIMGEIDISALTLEQYFKMIDENHAPGMVNEEFGRTIEKDIEDMTIAEYMKYKAEMKRQSWRDSQSYFPATYDNWDVGSFHLEKNKTSNYLYSTDDAKINAYYNLPPLLPCFKPIQPCTKCKNESCKAELDEEINYMSDEESLMSEQGTIDNTDAPDAPNLEPYDEGMSNDDDVDEWFVTEIEEHMKTSKTNTVLEASSMASNETIEEDSRPSRTLPCQLQPKELSPRSFSLPYTIGTVENVLVKIDIVIDMPGILGEMITLDKPFLATIHAQIDVFNGEISFGIGEDKAKLDVNRNSHHSNVTLKKVYMATKKESFNPLKIKDDLFSYKSPACLRFEQNTNIHTNSDTKTIDSPRNIQETSERCADHQQDNKRDTSRWHVCKPIRVFYDNGSGEDYGIWPTCNLNLSYCSGYKIIYGKAKHGMLKQWVCFRDYERRNAKGSCKKFADFLHVCYGNQKIDNTTQERRYYEWVAQNYEFDNDRIP
ncbi:putative ribonuclease H-like domain-containing protein [Tanacetum coccineum]